MGDDIQSILDGLVPASEAAGIMGVSRTFVNMRIRDGRLPSYSVGTGTKKIYLVPRKAAEQYERERAR